MSRTQPRGFLRVFNRSAADTMSWCRPSDRNSPSFSAVWVTGTLYLLVGGEDHVLVDDDLEGPASAHGDRGLAVQITLSDPLAGLLGLVGDAAGGAIDHQAARASGAGVLGRRRAYAENR